MDVGPMNTFEFAYEQNVAIKRFAEAETVTSCELSRFLRKWGGHPDYEVEYIDRVIDSLVDLNVQYSVGLASTERFDHLKALVKAVEVAFRMKRWEWDLQRKTFWRGYPLFFAGLSGMIEDLEAIRFHAAKLTPIFTPRVVLVEGESEKEFIEALQRAIGLADLRFETFTLGGSGALGSLAPYATEKRRTGTRLYICYDGDGNGAAAKQKREKLNRTLSPDGIFIFARDFESAFPADVMSDALNLYESRVLERAGLWSAPQIEELHKNPLPFAKALEQHSGLSINKRELGRLLAEVLINRDRTDIDVCYGKGWIEDFEIARFLAFLTNRDSA